VILSGWLVRYLGSPWPDLIIGLAIALLVIRGGMRIKRESRMEALDHCQPTSA
jgi:Co/Zn/Cd efflux system component